MLSMRLRLAGMVSVISTCILWGIATVSGAEQQPNVILFLVDDMGPMDTSVPFMTDGHGNAKKYPLNDYYRTPAMARLAASGIRFSTFYAMSVCSPTRTSIITGRLTDGSHLWRSFSDRQRCSGTYQRRG